MKVLIPAYEPRETFLRLIQDIREYCHMEVIIIDDGSGKDYEPIFKRAKALGSTVLYHPNNLGKGAALKTGFRYLINVGEEQGVICADCDGQHRVEDICKVAEETCKDDKTVVLGARQFTGKVPFRSKFGNYVTRKVFSLREGYEIYDTQTGLRGYPAAMLPWLCKVEGDRFEYEMNVLLKLKSSGYFVKEIMIDTIYEKGNESSHFRPLIDSFQIYMPLVKFTTSSLLAALLDFGLLLFFQGLLHQLLFSVVLSRSMSSIFNYSCNKYFVFQGKQSHIKSTSKYFMLVVVIMVLNYILLNAIVYTGIPLAFAKIITEIALFLFSYITQRKLVFIN